MIVNKKKKLKLKKLNKSKKITPVKGVIFLLLFKFDKQANNCYHLIILRNKL